MDTYEKKYKELLAKATKMHNEDCDTCQMCLEQLFPELVESEDERIRKEIIAMIKEDWPGRQDAIAWLEKQGEKKPVEWSERDKEVLNSILELLENLGYDSWKNWLKSLRPHKQWKPSEEQMKALMDSTRGLYACKDKNLLLDLYEQLKAL